MNSNAPINQSIFSNSVPQQDLGTTPFGAGGSLANLISSSKDGGMFGSNPMSNNATEGLFKPNDNNSGGLNLFGNLMPSGGQASSLFGGNNNSNGGGESNPAAGGLFGN